MVVKNFKLKGALIAEYGTQSAAARIFEAAGCPTLSEHRLSRLINGYAKPTPMESQIIRERLGIELQSAER